MIAARMAAPTTAIGTAIATLVVVLMPPPPPPPSSLSAEAMEVLDEAESEIKLVVDAEEVYVDVSVAWVVDADGLSSAVIVAASVAVASAHSEMELIGLDCPFRSG
jgi:hypothetical protein